eukprot:4620285-Amphidinium_carterae.1
MLTSAAGQRCSARGGCQDRKFSEGLCGLTAPQPCSSSEGVAEFPQGNQSQGGVPSLWWRATTL